jgi:hypothetical protein
MAQVDLTAIRGLFLDYAIDQGRLPSILPFRWQESAVQICALSASLQDVIVAKLPMPVMRWFLRQRGFSTYANLLPTGPLKLASRQKSTLRMTIRNV